LPAYLIIQIKLLAERRALAPYRDAVGPCAARFGGRYLVAGGVKVETLEGAPHDGRSLVVFEFPSLDSVRAFWESPEYLAVKKLRDGLVEMDVWAVPGVVEFQDLALGELVMRNGRLSG
jgi:uncharacterized protein (DUF1330 family)